MPRAWATSPRISQNAEIATSATTPELSVTAPALASQTRLRRGTNSSWLVSEPDAQSAPTKVQPAITIRLITTTASDSPQPRGRERPAEARAASRG